MCKGLHSCFSEAPTSLRRSLPNAQGGVLRSSFKAGQLETSLRNGTIVDQLGVRPSAPVRFSKHRCPLFFGRKMKLHSTSYRGPFRSFWSNKNRWRFRFLVCLELFCFVFFYSFLFNHLGGKPESLRLLNSTPISSSSQSRRWSGFLFAELNRQMPRARASPGWGYPPCEVSRCESLVKKGIYHYWTY